MARSDYEYVKKWRKRNPGARKAEYQRRKHNHPEKIIEYKRKAREKYRREHPLKPENAKVAVFYKGPFVSRQEAIKLNVKKYFTGRACKFGHVDQWAVSGGCIQCRRMRLSKKEKGKSQEFIDLGSVRPKPSVCDICGRKGTRIILDHCHGTGNFRGWLCDKCNFSLGLADDDPKILRKMAKYLERYGKAEGKNKECFTGQLFCWAAPQLPDK